MDLLAPFILVEDLDEFIPFILLMIDRARFERRLTPWLSKTSCCAACHEEPGLDASEPRNYRPISSLSFLSKTVEGFI